MSLTSLGSTALGFSITATCTLVLRREIRTNRLIAAGVADDELRALARPDL